MRLGAEPGQEAAEPGQGGPVAAELVPLAVVVVLAGRLMKRRHPWLVHHPRCRSSLRVGGS